MSFAPNPQMAKSFRAIIDFGKVVGTRGEQKIRVIINKIPRPFNAFPEG